MPTIDLLGPYRFFFWSNEGFEPPHVHVERDENTAKFWLEPVELAKNDGFRGHELTKLGEMVSEHQQEWLEKWHDHHRNRTTS